MKILLAHPGTQYSFQLARQLHKHGVLYSFHTGLAYGVDSWMYKMAVKLPASLFKKISNRFIYDVPDNLITRHCWIEIAALLKLKIRMAEEHVLYNRNKQFQKDISSKSIERATIVIGFDTSSWILAERCKLLNKKFILDISIGHPLSKEKIYSQLYEKYPLWRQQIIPKPQKLIDIECKEMELSDLIVVPGRFVKQTLIENGVSLSKIKVNAFGTFPDEFKIATNSQTGKMKFLFLGSFTARKGLPLLLDAWNEIDHTNAELIIAGYGKLPEGIVLTPDIKNRGVIAKEDRQALFNNSNVFLFPSFFEGLAQVQLEALASGLPVVGTTNSGAEEIVHHGVNGFIIEPGNKEGLKKLIRYFINTPKQAELMGVEARQSAEQFTWDAYGDRWINILLNAESNERAA